MEYRKLGNSDVEISAIAFGAWAIGGWMWGGTDHQAAREAILKSLELGVTTIDTAPVYGFGLSEEIVGEALVGRRQEVQLLTKFGLRWEGTDGEFYFDSADAQGNPVKIYKFSGKQSVIRECEASLKRLRTDYIDLLQIHWPDSTTPISETMEACQLLIDQGKIRAAGVSNYSAAQMREALQTLPIVSNQVPYSMVLRKIEEEVVPLAIERNVGILAYSPLQRGLLTGKMRPGQAFGAGDHRDGNRFFSDTNIERVNAFLATIKPLADDKGATLSQLVLRWTIEQPGITCALAGARNAEQAATNAKAIEVSLSPSEMEFIQAGLAKLVVE